MRVKVKKLPKSKVELEIEIEAKAFEKFFSNALSGLSNNLEIPGFRKGKVPKDIVLQEIEQKTILMEAANLAIKESYSKAVLEKKLEVISQPKIEILKLAPNNSFCFRAVFFVLPEIELPDYKEIASKVKRKKVSIKGLEIENALTWLQKSRPKFKELSRAAKKGDFVEIEFLSPQIENGKMQKDAFLLGEGRLVKGFEEKLEGMKNGEQKTFSTLFPQKHFRKELAGKKVDFEVKMVKVSEVEFPEINDRFARELGDFENLDVLRQSIKQGIRKEKELAESQRIREEILEKIEQNSKIETPEILVEAEKQRMLDGSKQKVSQDFNLPFEDYLKRIKKSENEFLSSFEIEAQKRVKRFLILREIAKKGNIAVSEEEVKEETNKILKRYPDIGTVQKEVDLEKLKDYTKEAIRNEKTLKLLEQFVNDKQ